MAGLGVDRDGCGVAGIAEGAGVDLRLVAGGRFQARRVDVGWKELRLAVPDVRNFRKAHPAVGALHAHVTLLQNQIHR